MSEPKKISFGFSRSIKKPDLTSNNAKKENIELIDCIEAKTIKVIHSKFDVSKKAPLVIPMKQNTQHKKSALLNLIGIIKGETDDTNSQSEPVETKLEKSPDNLKNEENNLDALAAQEIIKELNKVETTLVKVHKVPLPSEMPLTGEKESTLDDYENIPIVDFGLAMLRGMGWEEGKGIGKNNEQIKVAIPELRPKGLGLGADRPTPKNVKSNANDPKQEKLQIKKNAFVKIIMGKQTGAYGQIEGLDEDSGRIFIKMALGGNKVSLNEFMVEPVTKLEYEKNGKVLNSKKYEEYKQQEKHSMKEVKKYIKNETEFVKHEDREQMKESEQAKYYKYDINASSDRDNEKYDRSKERQINEKYDKCKKEKLVEHDKTKEYNDKEKERRHDKKQKKSKKSHKKHKKRYSSENSSSSEERYKEKKSKSFHKSSSYKHYDDEKYSESRHRRSRSREKKDKDRYRN